MRVKIMDTKKLGALILLGLPFWFVSLTLLHDVIL